jgi:hypothetical protein
VVVIDTLGTLARLADGEFSIVIRQAQLLPRFGRPSPHPTKTEKEPATFAPNNSDAAHHLTSLRVYATPPMALC